MLPWSRKAWTIAEVERPVACLGHGPTLKVCHYGGGDAGRVATCIHHEARKRNGRTRTKTLVDYASEETKQIGFDMIGKELKRIPKEKVRNIAEQNIRDIIMSNRRDFRF